MAVGIFDSISTTKTHNRVLEVNLYNCVTCRERFMIPLPTFYNPMIEVQMRLYKSHGVILSFSMHIVAFQANPLWPWLNYYMYFKK